MSGYVRMGRGGAGNMIPKGEVIKQEKGDLEAQTSRGKSPQPLANVIAEEEIKTPPSGEYKHMGRGGAGNWYYPSEKTEGEATAEAPAPEEESTVPTPSIRQWTGRGGAGNFAPQSEQQPRQIEVELKEQLKEWKLQDEVRQSVDMVLERPGRAHLGPSSRKA